MNTLNSGVGPTATISESILKRQKLFSLRKNVLHLLLRLCPFHFLLLTVSCCLVFVSRLICHGTLIFILLRHVAQRDCIVYILRVLKSILSHNDLWRLYESLIESVILYCVPLFGDLPSSCSNIIRKFFRRARRIICFKQCGCTF